MGRRISWEAAVDGEEPLTPAGRFFLHPDMQNVIHCVVGLKLPVHVDSIKAAVGDTLLKHPRFSSLVVSSLVIETLLVSLIMQLILSLFLPIKIKTMMTSVEIRISLPWLDKKKKLSRGLKLAGNSIIKML